MALTESSKEYESGQEEEVASLRNRGRKNRISSSLRRAPYSREHTRVWPSGKAEAFQASNVGSNPTTRSVVLGRSSTGRTLGSDPRGLEVRPLPPQFSNPRDMY